MRVYVLQVQTVLCNLLLVCVIVRRRVCQARRYGRSPC